MNAGISIYFGNGYEENKEIVRKAKSSGVSYAFTSLHIPEETGVDYQEEMGNMLKLCRESGLNLIADISPNTLKKLGCTSYDELESLGIGYIRLDFGFDAQDVAALSHKYHVVFNASTITEKDIKDWKAAGADFTKFMACHNFYPKQYTGLSLDKIYKINRWLKDQGFTTMAFAAGNKTLRGPLKEGLPTAEEHRNGNVFYNMLQLFYETLSDVVLIGDVDVTDDVWERIGEFNQGYITLKAKIKEAYRFTAKHIHHDRPDSSEWVVRSQESRFLEAYGTPFLKEGETQRTAGSISISNEEYLRYNGELEIARTDLKEEPRVNVIGYVQIEDRIYLPYIKDGMGFRLKLLG